MPANIESDANKQESSGNIMSSNREGKCLLTCMLNPLAIITAGKSFFDQVIDAISNGGKGDADDVSNVKTMLDKFSQLIPQVSQKTKN